MTGPVTEADVHSFADGRLAPEAAATEQFYGLSVFGIFQF